MLTDKRRPALLQARRVPVRPDRALRCTGSGTSNYPSARRVCVRPPRGVRLFQKGRQLFQNRHPPRPTSASRSEEHTSEIQSPYDIVCRLLLEKQIKITCFLFLTILFYQDSINLSMYYTL